MSTLPLLLLTAQIIELGTVEFPAGPARGAARFYLVESEPRVDVTVHNDGSAPIWWRGAGLGCVSSHWIVPPASVDGTKSPDGLQSIACTMEDNEPVMERQLAQWALAPGQASETWNARPFANGWREPTVAVPPLDRWAWCHEFTLPRATPPPRTMDFECPALVLAWSRATGPRVFLSRADEVHFAHFDPFADEPFQRGLGPIPFTCGPLRGTAFLRYEEEWPVVEWTLTNPLEREVWWSVRGVGSQVAWGFSTLDFRRGREDKNALFFEPEIRRAHGMFAAEARSWFAPGETQSGTIAPFAYDPTGSQEWQSEDGPFDLQRWHFVLDSTWPSCGGGEATAPRFLPAQLHLYWDADHGFDAFLDEPERFRDGRPWKPFLERRADLARSASFPLGACDALLELRTWNGVCELQVYNAGADAQHWIPVNGEQVTWLREPGAQEPGPPPREEPAPWAAQGKPLHGRAAERVLLNVGESAVDSLELGGGSWLLPKRERDFTQPSEFLLPIAWPQDRAPEHDRDAQRGWLRVRWQPERGLDAVASAIWPF